LLAVTGITMPHSYEEIRSAAFLDILAGRENTHCDLSQYEHLKLGLAGF